jgi:hypothetical protein
MSSWTPDETAPALVVNNTIVKRALLRDAFKHATLEEYARACGVDVDVVMREMEHALDSRAASLETAGGEVFVLTAPDGRPLPKGVPDLAPNLWEVLRYNRSVDAAWELWRVHRALERAGWEVLSDPGDINASCRATVSRPAPLGVRIGGVSIPVLVHPDADMVADSSGLVGEYERAGARAVAVVCGQSGLDSMVTAVRRFALGWRLAEAPLAVFVLEAPRYQPVVLQAHDAAVNPVSVTQASLTSLVWGLES